MTAGSALSLIDSLVVYFFFVTHRLTCSHIYEQAEQSAQEMSQKLMQAALDNGGKDNISVMVVRWS